ncbi:MAG TPA: adenosylcobalamin-dependent ribonucleoside-diphosphate reductase, partial [Anaerolineales bacterium]|nr:adenosylcobalamin-dependent ribonucleoside-diphosphate reductase [Anaerolineales bacterium]
MGFKIEEREEKSKHLPTPPLPAGAHKVELTDNARKVFTRRYVRRGADGKPVESVEETFWRVAYHVAKVESTWGNDNVMDRARQFYDMLTAKQFFPNSPTFTGAGTPLGQLAACFVLPLSDDMGRWGDGIFQTLRNAALIQQTGGGNGFSFARLRPKGTLVKSSAGEATGPVGFLRVYDQAFGEIAQGGSRRGANMAVLRVDHPDIEEFISCKTDENAITNFNISVGITDAFMEAVENDDWWDLRFPDVDSPQYSGFNGTLEEAEAAGIPIKVYKRVRARELFDKIVVQSHHNGEPGVLFLDTANRANPVPHLYSLESTNPCGEQWLGPYENCCLGSVNLAQHLPPDGAVDWEKLQSTVELATIFLDDVVEANAYIPSVPQVKEAAMRARRIGLGIMGLGDLMYHVGVRYGSDDGQEFASQVMEFVRYHAMRTSIQLAKERGAFPAISGSIYDPENLVWKPPQPITPYSRDWNRPEVDWGSVVDGITRNGIRNAAQTTIAPTGTVATVAGCEGYGCEPVFALAYIRHVNDNGKDLQLTYTSPKFEQAMLKAGLDDDTREVILNQVVERGTCQGIEAVPDEMRHVFVVSQDISAEEHVRMQAALQAFVDNSLSKTVNFPAGAPEEDVASAYKLAWEMGCKGLTVYVTGSRQQVVLETKSTATEKETPQKEEEPVEQLMIWHETKKPRPRRLKGYTYSISTPLGKAFVTINENGGNQPFEVFISTSKGGSETAAVAEA